MSKCLSLTSEERKCIGFLFETGYKKMNQIVILSKKLLKIQGLEV